MVFANPGLRPGLSSAVPAGLDFSDGYPHPGSKGQYPIGSAGVCLRAQARNYLCRSLGMDFFRGLLTPA